MNQMNLPPCSLRLRRNEAAGFDEVFDPQRRKWVKLTPEEEVRQRFVHYLIHHLGYPAGRLANEMAIRVGQTEKRCDSVIFDTQGHPAVIVEYKATTVQLTQKVFDQIARYNVALQVRFLMVSNGLHHYCCYLDPHTQQFQFLQQIPPYTQLQALLQQP